MNMIDTEEAAKILGYSPGTLENWRQESPYRGPKYHKPAGKVFYLKEDLYEWLLSNERGKE